MCGLHCRPRAAASCFESTAVCRRAAGCVTRGKAYPCRNMLEHMQYVADVVAYVPGAAGLLDWTRAKCPNATASAGHYLYRSTMVNSFGNSFGSQHIHR
jgi:hypothetical protein